MEEQVKDTGINLQETQMNMQLNLQMTAFRLDILRLAVETYKADPSKEDPVDIFNRLLVAFDGNK